MPRTRSSPVQIYLSKRERAELDAMARRRRTNASALVRDWIVRAQAQHKTRSNKPQQPSAAADDIDPRQTQLFDEQGAA